MAKVIGLTGPPCSGKETVKDFIRELCAERGLATLHFSFSDEIKREAARRGIPPAQIDRDRITRLVRDMRRAEGPGVLAVRIVERMAAERADVYVVEAIRHPAEAEILRCACGEDFVLAAVVSHVEVMARRLLARTRPDESRTAGRSIEAAAELIRREVEGDAAAGVEVGRCIRMADITLRNDGSLEQLRDDVRRIFGGLIPAAP